MGKSLSKRKLWFLKRFIWPGAKEVRDNFLFEYNFRKTDFNVSNIFIQEVSNAWAGYNFRPSANNFLNQCIININNNFIHIRLLSGRRMYILSAI